MTAETQKRPRVPPRRFVRTAWVVHRAIYRITGGRKGLWPPRPNQWGAMRLTTVGRKSGRERVAILGYFEDGENLVTMAMNGWAEGHPAWWLNLQANPEATVVLAGGERRSVRGRAAVGDERERLWAAFNDYGDDVDAYARHRTTDSTVVVLEPRTERSEPPHK